MQILWNQTDGDPTTTPSHPIITHPYPSHTPPHSKPPTSLSHPPTREYGTWADNINAHYQSKQLDHSLLTPAKVASEFFGRVRLIWFPSFHIPLYLTCASLTHTLPFNILLAGRLAI